MSVLVYDCGSVENTVTAILDTESGAMIIRGNGDVDNYMNEYSPWYSEHSDILQVTVDKGITRIGSGTFYGCENLSFVEIASTVTSIGADVFQNCTSLTSIKIPKSITDIGNGTFADSGLTEVKFYGNPPTVGADIFDGVTADVYTPEGNEEWTETAKGTVAGNGSNLTWKTFDSKPNLIEYDELDYFWSKIKKWVNDNKSDSSLPIIDDKTFIKYLTSVISDSNHTNTSTTLYVNNPEYFSVNDCFYVKKDSTHFFYGIVSAVNNNTGALTYSIPASDGGTFFSPDDGQVVLNYGNPMNGGVYLDWANDRVDLYKNHTASLERDYNIYDPILNINAWDSTTASIAEENGVIDISGENNNGQAFGGVSVVKDKVMGRCFYFDGTANTYVKTESQTLFNKINGKNALTLSIRIKKTGTSDIVGGLANTSGHSLGTFNISSTNISFSDRLQTGNTIKILTAPLSDVNDWHTFTAVINYEICTCKLYVDGIEVAKNNNWFTGEKSDVVMFMIGAEYFNPATLLFTGSISEYKIFDKALTSEEVQVIYKQSLVTPYINSNMYEPILNLDADYSTTASIAVADGVVDVSGNDNNGQAYGGVVVNNGAYEFDGTDDVIEFSNLLQGKESLTLSVNFTFPELPSGSARFFNSFSNQSGYKGLSLYLQPVGKIGYQLFNSSQNIEFYPDFIYQPNTNYNVMLVVDGISHKVQVYKNAEKISDESFSGSLEFHTTEILRVGGFSKTRDLYKGTMTNVKIFDRALTAEEVYNVYQQSLNPEAFENPEKLISYDEINVHHFDNDSLIQDIMFRVGNLNGILDINDGRPGVFIGDENEYIKFDKISGLQINGTVQNAQIANQIGNTSIGNSTTPIYINNGVPTACGGSLDVDITGNAATATSATKATQDGSGNTITSTYATIAKTYDDTTNTSYRGMCGLDGSTSGWVRTTTSGIIPVQSGAAGSGHSGLGTSSWYFATAYIDNIYGKLNGNCTGSSGSCTGNAATATTATNSTNSKLTHTVGNTEYPLVFGSSFVITDAQQALRIGTPTATATNCALRCKAYCAAANTQGEAYIVCGNNLAKSSANNARGSIYLYGTSTAHTQIVPGNNSTSNVVITLPSSTGTLALTSSNITGSSASCTGNAATATTASACSGNAASATYATNIRVTDTDSNTWYPLVFSSGSAANTNYAARVDADSILVYPGTSPAANTQGYCYMQLGNGKAKATAGNKRGVLRIYGTGTSYTEITSAVASTARSISFPDKAGTVALTSDITAANIGYSEIATIISSATAKSVSNGWLKIGNVLINWGMVKYTNRGACDPSDTITFTKAYATNFIPSVILTGTRHSAGDGFIKGIRQDSVTNTSFKLAVDAFNSGAGFNNIQQLYWIAIGKG